MHRILWSVSLALALLGNGCVQAALPKDAPAPVKTHAVTDGYWGKQLWQSEVLKTAYASALSSAAAAHGGIRREEVTPRIVKAVMDSLMLTQWQAEDHRGVHVAYVVTAQVPLDLMAQSQAAKGNRAAEFWATAFENTDARELPEYLLTQPRTKEAMQAQLDRAKASLVAANAEAAALVPTLTLRSYQPLMRYRDGQGGVYYGQHMRFVIDTGGIVWPIAVFSDVRKTADKIHCTWLITADTEYAYFARIWNRYVGIGGDRDA